MKSRNTEDIECYFIAKENFTAEDRHFIKGERYPVYVHDDYFILMAENGEFNLTKKGLRETVENWVGLVNVEKVGND